MAALHISLLGGFQAHLGSGEALPLKGRKTQALVAYLALSLGRPRSREELVGLLWGDRGDQQARSSLRQSLSGLRKALGNTDNSPLIAERDAVSLDASAVDVDVIEFERLIDDGTPTALERAAEIYRGDLLDGIGVHDPTLEEWLRSERERLRDRARDALARLLNHQTGAGETDRAIATARRLLALDPLQEPVHRALMRLYAAKNDRTMALRQYQACCDVLGSELSLEPEAETERLAQDIRTGIAGTGEEPETATSGETSRVEALPLPDKPSVAVLPFVNMSGDPEQEYFSNGITEDIITGLTRFRELFVIAGKSSVAARDGAADVKQIGNRLGVAHVVEGSVRTAGNRVRVTVQLVDAASGHRVWAEHYDRDLDDIFAVQDEITNIIVATLAGRIEEASGHRAIQKPVSDMVAYDYLLRGRQCLNYGTKDSILEARPYFERALELDPKFATAYANLARSYMLEYDSDWTESRLGALDHAYKLAERAVALDHDNSTAWYALAWAQLFRSQYEQAKIAIERAIALNRNDYHNICMKGWCLALSGDPAESIACLNEAIRVNPFAPVDCLMAIGIAEYTAGRYEAAIEPFSKITGWGVLKHSCLAACYAQLGRDGEARAAAAETLKLAGTELATQPGAEAESLRTYLADIFRFQNPSRFEHLVDGLGRAGLPISPGQGEGEGHG